MYLSRTTDWNFFSSPAVSHVITTVVCIFVVVYTRYWDTVLEMSWPRFTYVVELNVDSVRNTDPQKLGVIDIRPHYVSVLFYFFLILLAKRFSSIYFT